MRYLLAIGLGVVAAGLGVLWQRAEQRATAVAQRVAVLEAARPSATAVAPVTEAPAPAAVGETTRVRVVPAPAAGNTAEYIRTIEELRARMNELQRELSEGRDAEQKAEARLALEAEERKKLLATIAELKEDAGVARRTAAALEVELRAKGERLLKAETGEKLATDRAVKAQAAAARTVQTSTEIEDLNRRRETQIVGLQRRFREVADLYRGIALNLQNPAGPAVQAGDVSRIQSALQQAEDDLRVLQTLNARAQQLARGK